jgi:hypothetical protein
MVCSWNQNDNPFKTERSKLTVHEAAVTKGIEPEEPTTRADARFGTSGKKRIGD